MKSLVLKITSVLSIVGFALVLATPATAAVRKVYVSPVIVTTTAKPPVSLP